LISTFLLPLFNNLAIYQNVFLENKIHSLFIMIDTKCM
jgi:hypothetical protein